MENASKALMIAGAVLLAILVVSLLIYFFSQPGNMYSSINDREEARTLQEFNSQYESFNRNNLYGADIVSVINKVNDNKKKYADNAEYQIAISLTITEPAVAGEYGVKEPVLPVKEYEQEELYSIVQSWEENGIVYGDYDYRTFKTATFECTGIEYSEETSRVNNMTFRFLKLSDL